MEETSANLTRWAPPIDLIDGNDLAEKLKELQLGVDIELVEKVMIKKDLFKTL